MTSAVLMAGYNNKWAVRKYAKTVAEHYGETFIESGYKPLREFVTHTNGKTHRKPLIQFTLEKLLACDEIQDIVIVGHQMLLEQRLGKFIQQFAKPCRIVNQNTKLASDIVKRFHIRPRKVKYNSIAGNMIKGYATSNAFQNRQHALFVASDSPLTSLAFMVSFLQQAKPYQQEYDIIVPAPIIDGYLDKLGRPTLKLLNDTSRQLPGMRDVYGRQGFRLSSLLIGNPHGFDVNTTNTAYGCRVLNVYRALPGPADLAWLVVYHQFAVVLNPRAARPGVLARQYHRAVVLDVKSPPGPQIDCAGNEYLRVHPRPEVQILVVARDRCHGDIAAFMSGITVTRFQREVV